MQNRLATSFPSIHARGRGRRLTGWLWCGFDIRCMLVLAVLSLAAGSPFTANAKEYYAKARQELADTIASMAAETQRETGRKAFGEAVIKVMAEVPRHEFVPENVRDLAYRNRPLPIGHGQTISQPYIVALMTDLLEVQIGSKVLEVGTGSGYQAAVLAELGAKVFTIEIIEPLGQLAKERLKRLGYGNVKTRISDGYYGWKEHAPFDAIIVTAAASHVPPPLVRQLKPGGRMVAPVGQRFLVQYLTMVEKGADGGVTSRLILPVRFVPLTGGH